jgi:hypothetical protein
MSDRTRTLLISAVLPAAVLLGLLLLLFNKMALSNLILARGDTFLYFYPYWHAAAQALHEGRIPFWNPAIFMGAPMLANSQVGFFYPLNWPFWYFLETPYAVSAAILLHILIASLGVYLLGRRVLSLSRSASLVAAASFAFGGYLTAQVEHINQLQGLAWLPWFLLALDRSNKGTRRSWLLAAISVGGLFALQLMAGHTQTTFITGVAILIWILADWLGGRLFQDPRVENGVKMVIPQQPSALFLPITALFAGVILALGLAAVQLLPTLQLMRYSSRAGGLSVNEVLSFSLPPHHLAVALLPTVNQPLFSEYVAFMPLSILALAFIGGGQWRRRKGVLPALTLTFAGLFLALGAYNPLYWLLARFPGFSFFRAPARWLVLYALGVALLAGIGWHLLWRWVAEGNSGKERRAIWRRWVIPPLILFFAFLLLLAIWGFAAESLVSLIPPGSEAPFERPSLLTVGAWLVEGLLVGMILVAPLIIDDGRVRKFLLAMLLVIGLVSGFLASRDLPYNNLTTPEAYFDLRPSTTRLLAETGLPPDRMLSLSSILFDPGDQAEIDAIYKGQLSEEALYDYMVAIKQKEIIAPNLPMLYNLASIDGFDGGILPLRAYSRLTSLLMADGRETADGRLREHLDSVPEDRWLDLFNARYLISDKTGDIWRDGVFFDRQHPVSLEGTALVSVSYLPDYEATEIRLLASGQPESITIVTRDGDNWTLQPQWMEDSLYRVQFPSPAVLEELTVSACAQETACTLEGLTLVDSRDGTFYTLVPGNYRLLHSGDVKIYENSDRLPRAFIVHDWAAVGNAEEAIAAMLEPDFDVRATAVIESLPDQSNPQPIQENEGDPGQVFIAEYNPERIVLQSKDPTGGLLILTDADYPGWSATIDGSPVSIYPADGLFRGVFVPPGDHKIVFEYISTSYLAGLILFILSSGIIAFVLAIWISKRLNSRRKS